MESILSELSQIPKENIYYSLIFLIFFTSLGLLPNNNDLLLIAIGILCSINYLAIEISLLLPLVLIVGEIVSFSFGHFIGKKVFQYKFIAKRIPPERRDKIQMKMVTHPKKLLMGVRATPAMRPLLQIVIGALGLPFRYVFSVYIWISLVYSISIISLSYIFSDFVKNLFS